MKVGARKWSLLIRCSKEIPHSKAAQAFWKATWAVWTDLTATHDHSHSLEPSSSSCLLLGGNGYNSLKLSPMMTSSLCNKKREVDKNLKEIYIQQINLTIKLTNPNEIVTFSNPYRRGMVCVKKISINNSPKSIYFCNFNPCNTHTN